MTIALLGLGAGMLSIAAPGHPAGLRVIGGLATVAGVAGAATLVASESTTAAAEPVFFGRHLLAVPIEVPPGLFVKRFIVVNTPDDSGLGCLSRLVMRFQLADRSTHQVAVGFRFGDNPRGASRWQANVCPRREW